MANEFHDTLNPKLWADNKLKPEVASKLKEIADAFIESMEVPRNAIKDIVITGSSASYNYTPHSDIDLHLIVDFDKVHKDCPIVGDFLISKKSEFNNSHDIYIYGIPVEVYAEATDNENVHNGLYSLKDNKWIDKPKKLEPVNNDIAVNAKYKEFKEAIEEVANKEEAIKLIDKIKRMRKAGLADKGEFSVENLVFKKLRNEGLIGKLMDVKKEGIDKELSLEECYENIINKIQEMCTSTMAMAPYPNPVVGQDQPTVPKKENKHRQKKGMLNYSYKKTWGRIEPVVEEIINVCEAILESKKLSDEEREVLKQFMDNAPGNVHADTAEKFKKAQGRIEGYNKNMQDADEVGKNILKGQKKREKQQNIYRYNKQASEKDPSLKKKQKDLIWKFIRMKQANIGKN